VLWLRPDAGVNDPTSGSKVSEWADQSQSGNPNKATQGNVDNQPAYWDDAEHNINFNPVVEFYGTQLDHQAEPNVPKETYLDLDVSHLPQNTSPRSIITVAKSNIDGVAQAAHSTRYIISWGTNDTNAFSNMSMIQNGTRGGLTPANGTQSQTMYSPDGLVNTTDPFELFINWGGATNNAAHLFSKMKQVQDSTWGQDVPKNWDTGQDNGARIGSVVGTPQQIEDSYWNGKIEDVIVYNRELMPEERQRISTYLALKYGYTIDAQQGANSNYLSSNGNIVWDTNEDNQLYSNNIAGIARDDAGGLNQKQSRSVNSGIPQIAVGLGSIEETNSRNQAAFTQDNQYLIWGDNGQQLSPETIDQSVAGNVYRAQRVWNVQNTNGVGAVQISVPDEAVADDAKLIVSHDPAFSDYTLTDMQHESGSYVADNVTLNDGDYFTFARVKPEAGSRGLFTSSDDTTSNDGSLVKVDENLNIIDLIDYETINGATVVINSGLQNGDALHFVNQNGITGSYNSANGVLTLTGEASVADYEEALRSVQFSTTSVNLAGDRDISFTLGSALPYSNGHFYEYIVKASNLTWNAAKAEAELRDYFGRQGYLVTIMDEQENDFVAQKTQGLGWIGAQDIERKNGEPIVTGDWRWVTGPEGTEDAGNGTPFWKGYTSGSTSADAGTVDGGYSNWVTGEPNNSNGEYVAHIFGPGSTAGQWNDYSPTNNTVRGYVVEYGGLAADDQTINISAAKTVAVVLPSPELASAALGSSEEDGNTITLTFDRAVQNPSDGFTVTIDGETFELTSDAVSVNGTKVTLKLPDEIDLTDAHKVSVAYDADKGDLQGTNDTFVDSFTFDFFDKTLLQDKADESEGLNEDDYTPASWAAYLEKRQDAQAVLDNPAVTQADIDAALTALEAAYDGLVDKSALAEKAAEAESLNAGDYKPDSWQAFENALDAAQDVLN
ncbi:FIVAR domain-containing protein, partial [Paenibacillus sepulcri]|nr:FIVAR domain-containing protein [Paenibacillus sepulcri]